MPRCSKRAKEIARLKKELTERQHHAMLRALYDIDDAFEDEVDEYMAVQLEQLQATRYVSRSRTYRKRPARWQLMLEDPSFFNDTEFLEYFRVTRPVFYRLLDLIKDDEAFQVAPRRTFRGGPDLHLLALLKYLGSSGNDNTSSKIASFFGIGKGSTNNYVRRTVKALLKLQDSVLTWPDRQERREIAQRFHEKYRFPNCVGVTDGTLLPLATKPTLNGEDYYTRKGSYAIHALITCDDVARIRDVIVGWPGSVHKNRIWSNSSLARDPESHFCPSQYLLGDSAIMIPAFKKPPRAELSREKSYFNTYLAKARIKSEHSIGLVKARFQFFKGIRIALTDEEAMRRIIELFLCACILQNLLIGEPIPRAWEDHEVETLDEDDELNATVPMEAAGGERRDQLLAFLLELRG